MSFRDKAIEELWAVALTTLYFGTCFGVLVVLKSLVLAEYQIQFRGLSLALLGALVVAKVVLVMEHVTLWSWLRRHPAALEVVARTVLYSAGAFVVLVVEKAFEARHEYGSFASALANIFEHRDMPHVWANTICVGGALLGFNALSVLRRHVGGQQLVSIYLSPTPTAPAKKHE